MATHLNPQAPEFVARAPQLQVDSDTDTDTDITHENGQLVLYSDKNHQVDEPLDSDSQASMRPYPQGGVGQVVRLFDDQAGPTNSQTNMRPYPQGGVGQVVRLYDNQMGSANGQPEIGPVPRRVADQRSAKLNALTSGPNQIPSLEMALSDEYYPFVEAVTLSKATPTYGVIKFTDIPISVTRSEILATLGFRAKVLNDSDEPVHMIIDRITGTTQDAYIEFTTVRDAELAIERFKGLERTELRPPHFGERQINYRLSNQSELMRALFPNAKGINWRDGIPFLIPDAYIPQDQPWNRFKGLVTVEEMEVLSRHCELAHPALLMNCPQRPYEIMISILTKTPWYAANLINLSQRYAMYAAVMRMVKALQRKMSDTRTHCHLQLNDRLLQRLLRAAMKCHGFTMVQKDGVAYVGNLSEERVSEYNMPPFANLWSHAYTLIPKPGVPTDLLEWYIATIRETSQKMVGMQEPEYQAEIRREVGDTVLYWGYFYKAVDLVSMAGPDFDNMTLAEAGRREFLSVIGILEWALGIPGRLPMATDPQLNFTPMQQAPPIGAAPQNYMGMQRGPQAGHMQQQNYVGLQQDRQAGNMQQGHQVGNMQQGSYPGQQPFFAQETGQPTASDEQLLNILDQQIKDGQQEQAGHGYYLGQSGSAAQ